MEAVNEFVKLYPMVAATMVFGYYLLPAGIMYFLFFVLFRKKWNHLRIQDKYPDRASILYEIKWSVRAMLIFAVFVTIMLICIDRGYTKMYFEIDEYGWVYFLLSPVLALFLHDTYYYWVHRLMHYGPVFRYVHLVHHRSKTPTPFAIYSFQPLEVVLQFIVYPLILFFVPYHPVAFGIFIGYDLIVNAAGHTGFEFLPKGFMNHWFFRWQNSVTHHDMHHSHVNRNFGLYFNIWDRLMGTLHKDYEKTFHAVKAKPG
jgi:sterol desaturase/sphingolipid hydroxylase (fatty acid hydroxylase superfamily)